MEENNVQLQLKKRARRRLVGAVVFVSVVAVLLPMVMDHEPRQVVHDVEIRIPGQDEKSFAPKFAAVPTEKTPDLRATKVPADSSEAKLAVQPTLPALEVAKAKPADKSVEELVEKKVEKPLDTSEKAHEKPAKKPPEKPVEKPLVKTDEAKRAAAILGGQPVEAKPVAKAGEYLVLIGTFSNETNVKNLKTKLGEQGIKTFSEPLDTPQGKKIRVRAGPFASREAAEKALGKMQKIGISGAVAAK